MLKMKTTIRLNKDTKALIEFLKSENKDKSNPPTTSQIVTHAILLTVYEQIKSTNDIGSLTNLAQRINDIDLLKTVIQWIDDEKSQAILIDRINTIESLNKQRDSSHTNKGIVLEIIEIDDAFLDDIEPF